MKCLRSGESLGGGDDHQTYPSSDQSLMPKDFSASASSSLPGHLDNKPDTGNIEEAESSLRESGVLNYEVRFLNLLFYLLCLLLVVILISTVIQRKKYVYM